MKRGRSRIGDANEFSDIAHFPTIAVPDTATKKSRIEIAAPDGMAIIVDSWRAIYVGLRDEATSSTVEFEISADENVTVIDADDEDTIAYGVFEKDRTTTGITMYVASDGRNFDRGLPISSRILTLLTRADSEQTLAALNANVEYHYEPITKAMQRLRGVQI